MTASMKIEVYRNTDELWFPRLEEMIEHDRVAWEVSQSGSIQELKRKLCRPCHRVSLVLLIINTSKELEELLEMLQLFENTRIIIVYSVDDHHLHTLGQQLNPCFVGSSSRDVLEVYLVLKKISTLQIL